jgi:hypothetical protein
MYDHVVLLSLDTLRSDGIAANPLKLWPVQHQSAVRLDTAVLDQITAAGAFFANCVSAAPYTSASHATFLTGKWPLRHGVFELFNRRLRSKTLFHHARRLGYRTLLKVDFPLILGPHLGFTDAVDEYYVEDDAAYLDALGRGRPTFSLAHFGGIHAPYGFHNLRFGGRAYVEKVREMESLVAGGDRREISGPTGDDELGLSVRYKQVLEKLYRRRDYDRLFSLYLEGINHFLRTRFAPFFAELSSRLAGHRFLVVVFGDHGEEYDEESYGHQNTLAEGALRVPLVFYGPEVPPSFHRDRIRSVDLAPTLLELMGDPARGRLQLDGSSLAEVVRGRAGYPVRAAFAQAYASDDRKYLAFVKRTLLSGRKTGSLPHVLHKEVVYDGAFKLLRQEYEYVESEQGFALRRCPPRLVLEEVDAALCWHPRHDAKVRRALARRLDEYHRLVVADDGGDGRVVVTEDIQRQLRDLGYRI